MHVAAADNDTKVSTEVTAKQTFPTVSWILGQWKIPVVG